MSRIKLRLIFIDSTEMGKLENKDTVLLQKEKKYGSGKNDKYSNRYNKYTSYLKCTGQKIMRK